jgi:hypothetical protein
VNALFGSKGAFIAKRFVWKKYILVADEDFRVGEPT